MWGHKDAEDMDAGRRRNSTRYKARTVSSELLIENGAKRGPSLCSIKNLTQKFQRELLDRLVGQMLLTGHFGKGNSIMETISFCQLCFGNEFTTGLETEI